MFFIVEFLKKLISFRALKIYFEKFYPSKAFKMIALGPLAQGLGTLKTRSIELFGQVGWH